LNQYGLIRSKGKFEQSKICAVEYDHAEDWMTAKYLANFIIKEKDLLNDDVEIML